MIYSVEMANRAIPLVRRIVDDLVMRYADWQDAVSRFEYATTKSTANKPDPEAEALQNEAETHAEEIESLVSELDELRVDVLAFDTGSVVFPGEIDGCAVPLRWTRGETSVSYDAGSASAKGTSTSMPSRAQETEGNSSFASRSRSEGSRE